MRVQLSCPQCGAPLELEETEHILTCTYCRVRLMIFSRGPCRYYLPPAQEAPADIFFVPYWRLKGTGYALDSSRVLHKIIDTSMLARKWDNFPFSLGLRPQAMRLRHLTPEVPGYFFQPNTGRRFLLEQIGQRLVQGRSRSPARIIRQDFVGEIVSLIYAPFFIYQGAVYDGITRRIVDRRSDTPACKPEGQSIRRTSISFQPTLCPHCGWDMLGESRAVVLVCPGCFRAWTAASAGFRQIGLAMGQEDAAGDYHLPFWQLSLQGREMQLSSMADLVRLTNLSKPLLPAAERKALTFWIPAFKIRPDLYLRIASRMTVTQLEVHTVDRLPAGQLHPADLPLKEGLQSIPYLLASLGAAKGQVVPLAAKESIKARKARLAFIPFRIQGSEYLRPDVRMSIPRRAVQWGAH